jgi:hypothetical protein
LDKMHRLGWTCRIDPVGIIALGVHDSRACAHSLGKSWIDQPGVAR